ncbi:hypothetical protein V8E36_001177 [Tilletia maclaganii]
MALTTTADRSRRLQRSLSSQSTQLHVHHHHHHQQQTEVQPKERPTEYLTGILLLLLVVILWTASNFLTNTVLTRGYDKPFAVTFANTSSFALYLVPFLCISRTRRSSSRRIANAQADEEDDDGDAHVATPDSSAWLVKLGFILPERHSPNATPRRSYDDPEEVAGLLAHQQAPSSTSESTHLPIPNGGSTTTTDLSASIESLRRPRSTRTVRDLIGSDQPRSRPSSIDGRRPRSTLLHTSSFRELIVPAGGSSDLDTERLNGSLLGAEVSNAARVGDDELDRPVLVELPPLTLWETGVLAAQFTVVWFVANWSLNAGLGLTSVASGTTLSSASGFFTLGLGALFGVERFTFSKLGAVTISFIGVVLVTRADSVALATSASTSAGASLAARSALDLQATAPINAPLGDFLAIVSAFSYAVYVTLLKLKIGSEDRISMPLFFGFVGAINIICLWPVGLLLHLTGIEPFQLPQDGLTWAGVLVNMAITFISDFAYLLAMLKSSPLIATVGLSLTIPLALAGDVLRGSHSGGWLGSVGSIMVLFSFVAIGFADLNG